MDDEQHYGACGIISSTENTHKDELEKVLAEADGGVGESIREIWNILIARRPRKRIVSMHVRVYIWYYYPQLLHLECQL